MGLIDKIKEYYVDSAAMFTGGTALLPMVDFWNMNISSSIGSRFDVFMLTFLFGIGKFYAFGRDAMIDTFNITKDKAIDQFDRFYCLGFNLVLHSTLYTNNEAPTDEKLVSIGIISALSYTVLGNINGFFIDNYRPAFNLKGVKKPINFVENQSLGNRKMLVAASIAGAFATGATLYEIKEHINPEDENDVFSWSVVESKFDEKAIEYRNYAQDLNQYLTSVIQ